MSKHTPGPWRVKIYKPYRSEAIIVNDDGEIASVDLACMPGAEEDAHLIAAAPDMLEALEAAIGDQEDFEDGRLSGNTVATIRTAIKKARGQS
jgi:hypothetical protein